MDSLYLLIPLSALLVLGIIGVFAWALQRGQFDDLDREGQRILDADPLEPAAFDAGQGADATRTQESPPAERTTASRES